MSVVTLDGNRRIAVEGPLSSEEQSFGLSESVDSVFFLRFSLPRVQVKRLVDVVCAE